MKDCKKTVATSQGRSLRSREQLKPQGSYDKSSSKMQIFLFDFSPVQTEAICHASHREHVQSVTHPHISVKSKSMKTQPTCDLS